VRAVAGDVLKVVFVKRVEQCWRFVRWSVVRIRGRASVAARTLNCISCLRVKSFPSAGSAGAASLKKILTGELSWRISV